MSNGHNAEVLELLPQEAWAKLVENPRSVLVDVRTKAEWTYVGLPDLSGLGRSVFLAEWRSWPDMSLDPTFANRLLGEFGAELPSALLFICRSGIRSMEAAQAVADRLAASGKSETTCINVAEGFEGDLDANGHRGFGNGWKARGLAWRQT